MRHRCKERKAVKGVLIGVVLVLGTLGCQSISSNKTQEALRLPHLYLIGDSTVSSYPAERYPLTGWGQVLPEFFDPDQIEINNAARSGRSSKSFYEEGLWQPVRDQLRPGDYVFIQFGHNDSKQDDPARYTEPRSSYQEYLSRYIAEARSRGATPVLVTPIYRNAWKAEGRLGDSHGDYPPAMRALAHKEKVPLLDLHAMTGKRLQELGQEKSTQLFMNLQKGAFPAYPEGKTDNTHLRDAGAREICRMIAKWIADSGLGLAHYLRTDAAGLEP